jgi:hypothetical protein
MTEISLEPSLGQIAYEAYALSVGWKTMGGGTMPAWRDQLPHLREAWNAAGMAAGAAAVARLQRRPLAHH